MKKYIVIALLIVLGTAHPSYAFWSMGVRGGGVPAASACTWGSGDAAIGWDHSGDAEGGGYEGPYISQQFTLAATTTITGYKIRINTYTGPHDWTVSLYTDSGSNTPSTEITGTSKTISDNTGSYHIADVQLDSPKTGVASGLKWVVVQNSDADWSRIGCVSAGSDNFCNGATPATGCNYAKQISITVMGCAE